MAKNKLRTNVTRRDGRIVYNFHNIAFCRPRNRLVLAPEGRV